MGFKILIVDDEQELCISLSEILHEEGYEVLYAIDPSDTIPILTRERVDLIIMDIRMPNIGGVSLLRLVKRHSPSMKVIILTGYPSVQNAVLTMKYGAVNFYEKPPNLKQLLNELHEFSIQNYDVSSATCASDQIITDDSHMKKILQSAGKAASTSAPVLIMGESGTGKELIAGLVHEKSPRAHNPFIKINCAAIPESLLESELFGHEKGAFTDALIQKKGKFELANTGTIFLDEIGDMNLNTQAKILRVLQEKEFERVGGTETIHSDLRVIAATNKDLRVLIQNGLFREDLYYRLCVISLNLPPLRERLGDVALLINHFVKYFNARYCKQVKGLDSNTENLLFNHIWPGNIRELKNCIERAVIFCEGDFITMDDLPSQYTEIHDNSSPEVFQSCFDELNKKIILEALEKSKGIKNKAADILNINRRTLYNRMKKLGLE